MRRIYVNSTYLKLSESGLSIWVNAACRVDAWVAVNARIHCEGLLLRHTHSDRQVLLAHTPLPAHNSKTTGSHQVTRSFSQKVDSQ
jgi:hypothetical protein